VDDHGFEHAKTARHVAHNAGDVAQNGNRRDGKIADADGRRQQRV
jgi:hypothetical protein